MVVKESISKKLPIMDNIDGCLTLDSFQRLLTLFIYNAAAIVLIYNKDGKVCFGNNAAAVALGYDLDELLHKHIWEIDPNRSPKVWKVRLQEWKIDPYEIFESIYVRKDGSRFPVQIYGVHVEFNGRPYVCVAGSDITRRVTAEDELRRAKAETELYLDFLTHDIGNMNQISSGYLEMALEMLNSGQDIKLADKQLVEAPYNATQNVTKMVDVIKKVQRERRGYYKKQRMNMARVLNEVVNMFKETPGRNIRINIGNCIDCDVVADELLKDVFYNIIGNAIKHSSGSLNIDINMTCMVYGTNGKSYCTASISDNGPGVPDEKKKILFEVTDYRDSSSKARNKGFGIYLVQSIVQKYGGAFWVEDRVPGNPSKGAKFSVSLPMAK